MLHTKVRFTHLHMSIVKEDSENCLRAFIGKQFSPFRFKACSEKKARELDTDGESDKVDERIPVVSELTQAVDAQIIVGGMGGYQQGLINHGVQDLRQLMKTLDPIRHGREFEEKKQGVRLDPVAGKEKEVESVQGGGCCICCRRRVSHQEMGKVRNSVLFAEES